MTSQVMRCIATHLNLSQTNVSSELPHILLWHAMHPGQVGRHDDALWTSPKPKTRDG